MAKLEDILWRDRIPSAIPKEIFYLCQLTVHGKRSLIRGLLVIEDVAWLWNWLNREDSGDPLDQR